jgi:pyruvate,orthophosphate dikinase
LQTRNGKRTAMAALKFSVDMQEKLIDWKTAIQRTQPTSSSSCSRRCSTSEVAKAKESPPASRRPGAASGRIYLNAERAVAAEKGEKGCSSASKRRRKICAA